MAVIFEEIGETQKAKEIYQEVLQVEPEHVQAKVNYGILLDKEGKCSEAYLQYSDAIRLD